MEAIPSAEFNLVLSPYQGLKTAQLLQEKFDTPYLHYPVLPVGGAETSKFLRTVAEFAGTWSQAAADAVAYREREFYHYLVRSADLLTEFQLQMPRRFININDASYALAFSKFLVNELGYFPIRQFITENVPEEYRQPVAGYFQELGPGISTEVTFAQDGGVISEVINSTRIRGTPLVLGSSWEIDLVGSIKGLQLSVALPVIDRLILHRSYVGYRGGLNLVEDIYSKLLALNRG